ncbi:MAG: glycosyltransferase family 39 protein [Elusimicrobiota bacterium]
MSNYNLWFWIINAVTALIRLLIIGRLGLSGDEAHYWVYAQNPELSYFDHPPAIGYIVKATTVLFGNNEFGVRFSAVLFFFLLSWIFFRLVKDMYGEKTAFWGTVMLNLTPVFSFLGASMSIPDSPLSILWMLFIFVFWKLLKEKKAYLWYVLGLILGLGLLSKYNAILLVPSLFLFLVFSKEHRHWLKRREPYLALIIAFIVFLPVVIWNLQNNFASFGFQLKRGIVQAAPQLLRPDLLLRCLAAQSGYVSPVIFIVSWAVLALSLVKYFKARDEKLLFLLSFSVPTLFLFNGVALFKEILPHWPAMGYLVLMIAVADYSVRFWNKLWFRNTLIAGWAVALGITLIMPLHSMFKVIPVERLIPKDEAAKIENGIARAEKIDITNDIYGWREVGAKINEIIEASPEPKPFIFTKTHYIAAQLQFYTPKHPRVYALSTRPDAFDFWQRDLGNLDGRDGIFVCNDFFYAEPQTIYPFRSWKPAQPVEIFRNSRKIRIFWLTYGRKFDLKRLPWEYTSLIAGPQVTLKQGLIQLDQRIFWFINKRLENKFLDFVMGDWSTLDATLRLNTGLVMIAFCMGYYLWKTRRDRFWREFMIFAGILLAGGIIIALIKDIIGRSRPLALWGGLVNSFGERHFGSSFPSGHAETAFSAATYLAYKVRKFWWIVLFFAIAFFTGLSRIYVGVHFPVDVAIGSVIGVVFTVIAVKLFKIDKT